MITDPLYNEIWEEWSLKYFRSVLMHVDLHRRVVWMSTSKRVGELPTGWVVA